MALRPELRDVVGVLLNANAEAITLDAIGDALGTLAVSTDEVEAILSALEAAKRRIVGPEGAQGAETLKRVIPAARALASSLGRKPTLDEIASHLALPVDSVRHAIALGRVMGR